MPTAEQHSRSLDGQTNTGSVRRAELDFKHRPRALLKFRRRAAREFLFPRFFFPFSLSPNFSSACLFLPPLSLFLYTKHQRTNKQISVSRVNAAQSRVRILDGILSCIRIAHASTRVLSDQEKHIARLSELFSRDCEISRRLSINRVGHQFTFRFFAGLSHV